MQPPLVTAELLARLEAAIRATGSPALDLLPAPGASDAVIDNSAARAGLQVPAEARLLWRWRNGVALPTWTDFDPSFNPHRRLLPIEEAAQLCIYKRDDDRALNLDHDVPLEYYWRDTWMPLAQRDGGPTAIDCSERVIAPVHSSHSTLTASDTCRAPHHWTARELVDRGLRVRRV